jgi:hypothetical protein
MSINPVHAGNDGQAFARVALEGFVPGMAAFWRFVPLIGRQDGAVPLVPSM